MWQLIKLEIRKYKLKSNIKGVSIAILCIMAILTMSFFDTTSNPKQKMDTYENALWIINVLVTNTFLVYSSALMSKIVIGEYKNKTILVMFSYPISRKKIMLSKLLIVVIFAMVCIFIGDILCTLYLIMLDSYFNVIEGSFSFSYFSLATFLVSIFMGGILSLLPFAVGMIKKSVPTTIVTAVIIASLMQSVVGRDQDLANTIIKLAIIALVSIGFALITLRKNINDIVNVDTV